MMIPWLNVLPHDCNDHDIFITFYSSVYNRQPKKSKRTTAKVQKQKSNGADKATKLKPRPRATTMPIQRTIQKKSGMGEWSNEAEEDASCRHR